MILGLQIGLLILGIMTLAKGQLKYSKTRVVTGAAARVVGVIAILPLPLIFIMGFVVGYSAGTQGKRVEDIQGPLATIDVTVPLISLMLVILISAVAGKTVQPPQQSLQMPSTSDLPPFLGPPPSKSVFPPPLPFQNQPRT